MHGALLARRDVPADTASLAEHGIEPIDLVVVNLYPFAASVARATSDEDEVIEAIDIGGPAMIRAAAKNHANVGVVIDPERYGFRARRARARAGELEPRHPARLAAEAFAHTAGYDIAIANWFPDAESSPTAMLRDFVEGRRPALRREPAPAGRLLPRRRRPPAPARRGSTQHGGKELSFNNLLDLDAARRPGRRVLRCPACAIVKHGNPCGVALAAGVGRGLRAGARGRPGLGVRRDRRRQPAVTLPLRRGDRRSIRRGRPRARLRRRRRSSRFSEQAVAARPRDGERRRGRRASATCAASSAGSWSRTATPSREDRDDDGGRHRRVSPTEEQWGDLLFAWRVAKHVRSNAIVLAEGPGDAWDRRRAR